VKAIASALDGTQEAGTAGRGAVGLVSGGGLGWFPADPGRFGIKLGFHSGYDSFSNALGNCLGSRYLIEVVVRQGSRPVGGND
jgi:hypothetical protein